MQGNFNIINLKGSLIYPKNGDPMKGQLSITLAGNDGKVFGGVVHGRLIAQSTVQVIYIYTSFLLHYFYELLITI